MIKELLSGSGRKQGLHTSGKQEQMLWRRHWNMIEPPGSSMDLVKALSLTRKGYTTKTAA